MCTTWGKSSASSSRARRAPIALPVWTSRPRRGRFARSSNVRRHRATHRGDRPCDSHQQIAAACGCGVVSAFSRGCCSRRSSGFRRRQPQNDRMPHPQAPRRPQRLPLCRRLPWSALRHRPQRSRSPSRSFGTHLPRLRPLPLPTLHRLLLRLPRLLPLLPLLPRPLLLLPPLHRPLRLPPLPLPLPFGGLRLLRPARRRPWRPRRHH